MKRKPVIRLLVLVFVFLAAFPAASLVLNSNRPSLGRVFLSNQESSVSMAVRNDTADFAFAFDVDARKASALTPPLATFFNLLGEETEQEFSSQEVPFGPWEEGEEPEPVPEVDPEPESPPLIGVFDDALRGVFESLWNEGVVRVELALELPVRVWEVPVAAWTLARVGAARRSQGESVEPDEDSAGALKALLLRQLQGSERHALALVEEVLDATVLDAQEVEGQSHRGFVQLDVDLVDALADSLCPEEPRPFDACRIFDLPREDTRLWLARSLDVLGTSFQIQLHFRWQLRGTMLFVANTEEGLQRITEARRPPPGLLASLPVTDDVPSGRVAFLLRQSRLQNNLLALLSGVERQSAGLEGAQAGFGEYLGSPAGEESIAEAEDILSYLTRWSSELLLEARTSGQGFAARVWYENPDVVRGAEAANALVEEVASQHFQAFFSPWLGKASEFSVHWASEDRVVVECRLEGSSKDFSTQFKPERQIQ